MSKISGFEINILKAYWRDGSVLESTEFPAASWVLITLCELQSPNGPQRHFTCKTLKSRRRGGEGEGEEGPLDQQSKVHMNPEKKQQAQVLHGFTPGPLHV